MIDGGTYSCIITDQEMPGVTGLELIQEVRESPISIPVVVFTGSRDKQKISELKETNVAGVYIKGETTFQTLLSEVSSIVRTNERSVAPPTTD